MARLERTMLRAILDNLDIIAWTIMPQHALIGQNIRELYRALDVVPLDRACKGELQHTPPGTYRRRRPRRHRTGRGTGVR